MATPRKLKCAKCGRKFSMAAHLARHMNTTHSVRRRKKTTAKRVAKNTQPQRRQRQASIQSPVGDGAAAVRGLRAYQSQLVSGRDSLNERIAALDNALAHLGASLGERASSGTSDGRGRRPRGSSLKEYVGKVLRANRRTMAVRDITRAVLKAGYQTKNATLDKSVGIALAEMVKAGQANKVGRGMFRI